MKKIYVCHQYYAPTHFQALYDCAKDYGYQVEDIIVLNPASALKQRQKIMQKEGLRMADEWYRNNSIAQGELWLLKDEIVIIGVAPYDRLLAQYQSVLMKNYSIYMTSWADWHSGNVPYRYLENKSGFMDTLTNYIDGVACVSNKTEEEIFQWNNVTQVVNHAIRVKEYLKKDCYSREGKYIFLGRLIDCKNINLIISYLKRNPNVNIQIDFAGDGKEKEMLQKYSEIDKRIHLLGYLDTNEIKRHLHEYDYLILPSKHELFGIVLLEALASGVPCIVSDVTGPKEIIQHDKTGIIFELKDEKQFYDAMDYSINLDDNKYKEMSKNAIFEGLKYDVNEVIKKWISLFDRVQQVDVKNK